MRRAGPKVSPNKWPLRSHILHEMSAHADRDLVEMARKGDGEAISELFSRYWRAARAAAFGVTGEFASAEDAASEGFRQALKGIGSLRDPERFGAWLRTIVVRTAGLSLRSRGAVEDASVEELFDGNERPDVALERLELGALIQLAVCRLPDRLREAVALTYFEGYDSAAAARFLDVPAGTLRRRLHDARTHLRDIVEKTLQGSRRMSEERDRQIERLKNLIEKGEIYTALRESLALRPPPSEVIDMLAPRGTAPARVEEFPRERVQRLQQLLRPSDQASDANHPVGSIAIAIRQALPEFQDWRQDPGEAAERFLTFTGDRRDRIQAMLPPGFAEGRPGSFLRASRAILHTSENGPARSVYQHLRDSPDEGAFRAGMNNIRMSDVLDLTWMVTGPLELYSVQEMLERLCAAVLTGIKIRFSAYDEPRYRSALQLQIGEVADRAAGGGVLAEWPGRPQGVDAAHLRLFLEPWATARSDREMPPR